MNIASNFVARAIQARFRKLRSLLSQDLVDIQEEAYGPWGESPDLLYINHVSPDSEVLLVPLLDPDRTITVQVISVYHVERTSLLTGRILIGIDENEDLGTRRPLVFTKQNVLDFAETSPHNERMLKEKGVDGPGF